MTEQDKKKFKTVPAMDMDEYKQKIREHRLKILKRTLVTALIVFVIIAGLFLFLALRHYEDFDVIQLWNVRIQQQPFLKSFRGIF